MSATKAYISSVLSKNKKDEPFPESLKLILNRWVGMVFNNLRRAQKEPFLVLESYDLCATTIPTDILLQEIPVCSLAVVDFERQKQIEWSVD